MINNRQDELKEEKVRPAEADWKCIFTQEDVMEDPVTVGKYTYDRTQIIEYFNRQLAEWEAGLQGRVSRNEKGEIDYRKFECRDPLRRENIPWEIDFEKNNHKRPTVKMTSDGTMKAAIAAWRERIATDAAPYMPSQEELFAEVKRLNKIITEQTQQILMLTKRIASQDRKQQPNVRSLEQQQIDAIIAQSEREERERREALLQQARLERNAEQAAVLLRRANEYLSAKNLDEAAFLATNIIALDLPTPQKHEFLIDAYCIKIEHNLLHNHITIANRNVGLANHARHQCRLMLIVTIPFEPSLRLSSVQYLRLARLNLLVGRVKLLNEVYPDTNAVQQAVAIFAHYKKEKELVETLILLGMMYLKNKQYDYAQEQFTKAKLVIESNDIGDYSLLEAGLGEICRLHKNAAPEAKEHYEKAIEQAEKNGNKLAAIIAQHGLAKLISDSPTKEQNIAQEMINRFTKLIKQYENCEYDLAHIIGQKFVENEYSLGVWAYFICGSNNYVLGQFKEALENLDSLFKKLNYYKNSSDDWRVKDYPGFLHYALALRARIYAEHPELFVPENDLQTKNRLSDVIHQTNLMLKPEEIKEASRDALIIARTARATAYLQQGELQQALDDYDHLINEKKANRNHERAKVYLAFALQELEPQKKLAYLMQATQDCSTVAKNASSWTHAYKISARETLCKAINELLKMEGHARQVAELLKDVSSWPVSEPSYKAARIYLATAHLQAQVADAVEVEAKQTDLTENERVSFMQDIHLLAKQLVDIVANMWCTSNDVVNHSGNIIKDGLQKHTSARQRFISNLLTDWINGIDILFTNESAKKIVQSAFTAWINFIKDAGITQQKDQVVVASGNGFFSNSSSPPMLAPTTTKQALTNNN